MKLLLRAYPRRWRDRYGDELLALLDAEPLTWRVRVNVVMSGLRERLRGSDAPQLRVLWAWSLFVIGGVAFQKTSEHWQVVVPTADRSIPTVAFDVVQVAAVIGSAAVLAGVALALPAFARDLRHGAWRIVRRPILVALAAAAIAAAALGAVALGHNVVAASAFVAFAIFALFAWTHAAAVTARRIPALPLHRALAVVVTATMVVMTIAAGVWFGVVTGHAPSFVGAAQLAVTATFMLAGTAVAASSRLRSMQA